MLIVPWRFVFSFLRYSELQAMLDKSRHRQQLLRVACFCSDWPWEFLSKDLQFDSEIRNEIIRQYLSNKMIKRLKHSMNMDVTEIQRLRRNYGGPARLIWQERIYHGDKLFCDLRNYQFDLSEIDWIEAKVCAHTSMHVPAYKKGSNILLIGEISLQWACFILYCHFKFMQIQHHREFVGEAPDSPTDWLNLRWEELCVVLGEEANVSVLSLYKPLIGLLLEGQWLLDLTLSTILMPRRELVYFQSPDLYFERVYSRYLKQIQQRRSPQNLADQITLLGFKPVYVPMGDHLSIDLVLFRALHFLSIAS